jgi:hypothetical protein
LTIFQSWEVAYLNLVDKPLGGPLDPLRLFDLGNFFVASPVVPMLVPHIDMLAPVVGTPLDLLDLIISVRLGPLALYGPLHHGRGRHWPLTKVESAFRRYSVDRWLLHPSRGWSSDLFTTW